VARTRSAGDASEQLLKEREQVRRGIRQRAAESIIVGLIFFVFVEGATNHLYIQSFLALPYKAVPFEWQFGVGIDDPEAAVIVTALLLLVATLSVALAALQISAGQTVSGSVGAFTWASVLTGVGAIAAAVSVALALTRVVGSFPLCLVLLGVTAMIIALTGSTPQMHGAGQAELELADSKAKLLGLETSVAKFPKPIPGTRLTDPVKAAWRNACGGLLWPAPLSWRIPV
jgi:hypothetical protein